MGQQWNQNILLASIFNTPTARMNCFTSIIDKVPRSWCSLPVAPCKSSKSYIPLKTQSVIFAEQTVLQTPFTNFIHNAFKAKFNTYESMTRGHICSKTMTTGGSRHVSQITCAVTFSLRFPNTFSQNSF